MIPELRHERHSAPVRFLNLISAEPNLLGPVRIRSPRGCVEKEANTTTLRLVQVGREVPGQSFSPAVVQYERESGEKRQVDSLREDERGFKAAICQELAVLQLW